MAFPQAVLTFVGGVGASVVGWALLMQIIHLSDRISRILCTFALVLKQIIIIRY